MLTNMIAESCVVHWFSPAKILVAKSVLICCYWRYLCSVIFSRTRQFSSVYYISLSGSGVQKEFEALNHFLLVTPCISSLLNAKQSIESSDMAQ